MSLRGSVCQQLILVWAGAALLVVALVLLDGALAVPLKFFWLLPYPLRLGPSLAALRSFFGMRPVLATAVTVPLLALLITASLIVLRVLRIAPRLPERYRP